MTQTRHDTLGRVLRSIGNVAGDGDVTGQRFGCNIISAVSNKGALRFSVFEGGFNQDVAIEHTRSYLASTQKRPGVVRFCLEEAPCLNMQPHGSHTQLSRKMTPQ